VKGFGQHLLLFYSLTTRNVISANASFILKSKSHGSSIQCNKDDNKKNNFNNEKDKAPYLVCLQCLTPPCVLGVLFIALAT
jgi:hypothetical protein